jgi:hypothetical protein
MSLPPFVGFTTTILWQQNTINNFGNSPPPQPDGWSYSTGDATNIRPYNPSSQNIIWSGVVPNSLNNITLDKILSLSVDSNFSIKTDFTFAVTSGSQTTACSGGAKLDFGIFTSGGSTLLVNTDIAALGPIPSCVCTMFYPSNGQFPTYIYSPESITSQSSIPNYDIKAIAWNQNFDCDNYAASNMTIIVTMKVTLTVTCDNTAEINSTFCSNFCTQNATNLDLCKNQYIDFCLVQKDVNGDINIFTNDACQTFIKDYIGTNGPKAEIDNPLTAACSQKISGLTAFNSSSKTIQNICACHLNPQFYDNIRTSLNNQIPGSKLIAEPAPCLFTPCVDSDFKSDISGKPCPLPACVNIASITNDGTVSGNNTITQSANCADISAPGSANNPTGGGGSGGGGSGGDTTNKSWWEQHWLWLVLGIGLLVVLIIVILIIIAAEGGKKKPPMKK